MHRLPFPGIHRPAAEDRALYTGGRQPQRLRGRLPQGVLRILQRKAQIVQPDHGFSLLHFFTAAWAATRADAQAHCRLKPPQSPSTSSTSPAK